MHVRNHCADSRISKFFEMIFRKIPKKEDEEYFTLLNDHPILNEKSENTNARYLTSNSR